MKNIYIFWIGDKGKIQHIVEKFESLDFSVHVGPTNDEHDILYNNYPYYRMAYNQQVWAFCSDVWRLYILSKNAGMYVDTSVDIGVNFKDFYCKYMHNDVTLFREKDVMLANSIMFSGRKNNEFFKGILEKYEEIIDENLDASVYEISPWILSAYVIKEFQNFKGFDDLIISKNKCEIHIEGFDKIRDRETIVKRGSLSWNTRYSQAKGGQVVKQYFEKAEQQYLAKKSWGNYKRKYWILIHVDYLAMFPRYIRNKYDKATTKEELERYKNAYLNLGYKTKISEKLFWSKLYRFFTFKYIKNNG